MASHGTEANGEPPLALGSLPATASAGELPTLAWREGLGWLLASPVAPERCCQQQHQGTLPVAGAGVAAGSISSLPHCVLHSWAYFIVATCRA